MEQKKISTIKINELNYVEKNGVLFRIKGQSVPYTFNSEEYSTLNMPQIYKNFTLKELITRTNYYTDLYKCTEADKLTIINKMNDIVGRAHIFFSEGNYMYIRKQKIHELGNAIACTILNELFLKGKYPVYYTNSYQFIQQAINKNMDYFATVRDAECVIIDTLDELNNTPPLYKKDSFYQLKSTIYTRSIKKKPTIIVSSLPAALLPNLLGSELSNYIINNLFWEMTI